MKNAFETRLQGGIGFRCLRLLSLIKPSCRGTTSASTSKSDQFAGQAIVSWSPSVTGWTLQTNNNLSTGTWGNYLGTVVNNSVTNAPPTGNVFFRLKQ
jgi:hypothetical protein